MKEKYFKADIKNWLVENTVDNAIYKTDSFAQMCIDNSLSEETDGDFIYEDDTLVLGKFYNSIKINGNISNNGQVKTLNYIVSCMGYKDSVGEILSLQNYDYTII